MESIIVLGSSSAHGNTYQIGEIFQSLFDADIVNLKHKQIGSYSYENEYRGVAKYIKANPCVR